MTPDLQALLDRLTTALAPSTRDRMNYGFSIQLTQVEANLLLAALSEARGRAEELEALLEQRAAAFIKFAKERPVAPHPVDQLENLRRAMTTDIELERLEAERDSLLAKLAEAERERDGLRSRDATRELLLKEAQANCDGLEEERDAALSELTKARSAAEAKHTDRSTPCPKCGFYFKMTLAPPFVFDDDDPIPSPPKDPAK